MNFEKTTKTALIRDFETLLQPANYSSFFTEKEIERYANKKSKGSLAARYLLKKEIITKLKQKPAFTDIEILNAKNNKPTLHIAVQNTKIPFNIYFSISHTKTEVAIIIVTD